MVLSAKKMLAIALCVSTLAAADVRPTAALRPHRRALSGIHHTTQYAPKVVKQAATETDEDSYDSYDDESASLDLDDGDSADVDLGPSGELDLDTSGSADVYIDGSDADVYVDINEGEELDLSADGDETFDLSSSGSYDFDASASLGASGEMDTTVEFEEGSLDIDLDDDEDYSQDLEFGSDEDVDEEIEVPEGAKKIRLRVHRGNVDLDIIKDAPAQKEQHKEETKEQPKQEEEKKEEAKPEEKKEETAAVEEQSVSYAAEAKDWIEENASKPAVLGGMIGAAIGIVGVAGFAIAKRRTQPSETSVLAEDVEAAEADAAEEDEDASESDSDESSDEDVEAGVTALTEADDDEEDKKTSVVEGSV